MVILTQDCLNKIKKKIIKGKLTNKDKVKLINGFNQ